MSIQYFAGTLADPGLECVAEVLICLGDLYPVLAEEQFVTSLIHLCEGGWKHIVYVPGILEAKSIELPDKRVESIEYEGAIEYLRQIEEKVPNLHVLFNDVLDLPDLKLRILGTPLFTDMALDADERTEEGRKELGTFLPLLTTTGTTNAQFRITPEMEANPNEGDLYIEDEEGNKRITLPLSKYWWRENHRVCRDFLAAAIADAVETLPHDQALVVATHWQPSHLLDSIVASQLQDAPVPEVPKDSLRFCQSLPLRAYARLLDRPLVWFYAQAKLHGRARTGVEAVDKAIIFYGTPSGYEPANQKHAVHLHTVPQGTLERISEMGEAAREEASKSKRDEGNTKEVEEGKKEGENST